MTDFLYKSEFFEKLEELLKKIPASQFEDADRDKICDIMGASLGDCFWPEKKMNEFYTPNEEYEDMKDTCENKEAELEGLKDKHHKLFFQLEKAKVFLSPEQIARLGLDKVEA